LAPFQTAAKFHQISKVPVVVVFPAAQPIPPVAAPIVAHKVPAAVIPVQN